MVSNLRNSLGMPAAAFVLLVLCVAARAATEARQTASAGDAALFDRLDANLDDSIAADEVAAENRKLFDRLLRKADADDNQALSRKEFLVSLVPTRPEKPMEEKEPTTVPGANAVRYLLLTMDTNRNARIEKDEVPKELKGALSGVIERADRNGNGALERQELSRGGPAMGAVAMRYVQRQQVDVDAELAKLKKSQGEAFNRFDEQPVPLGEIRDAKQARQLFAQFDENGDGKVDAKEVPDPLREPIERLVRIADRDDDGKLSQDEFVTATERIGKFLKRGGPDEMPMRERMRERMRDRRTRPGESDSVKK